jgi:hypothetical protein
MDIANQKWHSQLQNSSKLSSLSEFKSLLEPEKYLTCINIQKFRSALTRFRCSAHKLEIELGRRNNIEPQMRLCKFCERHGEHVVEDEYHSLMICPMNKELRDTYISNSFTKYPDTNNFIHLLQSQNELTIKNLAMFIYSADKHRSHVISTY